MKVKFVLLKSTFPGKTVKDISTPCIRVPDIEILNFLESKKSIALESSGSFELFAKELILDLVYRS